MGVEPQHGDARGGDAEVADQAFVHQPQLGDDAVRGQLGAHVFQRDVARDHANPKSVATQQHEHLVHTGLAGEVFGVAREGESRLADGVFVDGRRHKHVHGGFGQVAHRALKAFHGHGTGLLCRFTWLVRELGRVEVEHVDLAIARFRRITDLAPSDVFKGTLCKGARRKDHRHNACEGALVAKRVSQRFQPDAVGVAAGNADPDF